LMHHVLFQMQVKYYSFLGGVYFISKFLTVHALHLLLLRLQTPYHSYSYLYHCTAKTKAVDKITAVSNESTSPFCFL
jgi:hypothetical protein